METCQRRSNVFASYIMLQKTGQIKLIKDTDKRRRTNYNFYTEQKWGMARNYTLSLNSSQLGYERCEKMIIDCVDIC